MHRHPRSHTLCGVSELLLHGGSPAGLPEATSSMPHPSAGFSALLHLSVCAGDRIVSPPPQIRVLSPDAREIGVWSGAIAG